MKKVIVLVMAVAVLACVAASGWADSTRYQWVPAQGTYVDGSEDFTWSGNILVDTTEAAGARPLFLAATAWCEKCRKVFQLLGTPGAGSFIVYSMGHDPAFSVSLEVPGIQVALAH